MQKDSLEVYALAASRLQLLRDNGGTTSAVSSISSSPACLDLGALALESTPWR